MNVRQEINKFASDKNKDVLLWLFDKYHFDWQWRFVAYCTKKRYGKLSYETHRVWHPTQEGNRLFEYERFVNGDFKDEY